MKKLKKSKASKVAKKPTKKKAAKAAKAAKRKAVKPKRLNPLRKRPNAAKAKADASKARHRKSSKWCHRCLPTRVEAVRLSDGSYRTYCAKCTREYMKAYMAKKRADDPTYGQQTRAQE